MKRYLLIVLLLYLFSNCIIAQVLKQDSPKLRNNAIFMELGGNGGLYSVNYDHLFRLGESRLSGIGARIGVSYLGVAALNGTLIPIEMYYSYGKKSCLELGVGLTQFIGDSDLASIARIGYKYRGPKGFIFGVGPLFIKIQEGGNVFSGGIAFGFSF